jgi:hypothetical protein
MGVFTPIFITNEEKLMKDIIADIVKHTAGLGFISNVKITGTDNETNLDAMDNDRTVIVKGKLHAVESDFIGEFGLGNLGFLSGVSNLSNYKADDASIEVIRRDHNGTSSPDSLLFKDADGNTDRYRFMSKEIIDQQLQTVKFKGVDWDVVFEPSKQKVAELQQVSSIYSGVEPNFTVKTENGSVIITVGAQDGSYTGKRTFANGVTGELKDGYAWPLSNVLSVLKLGMNGACIMQISSKGALMITVVSAVGQYDYIFPALSI